MIIAVSLKRPVDVFLRIIHNLIDQLVNHLIGSPSLILEVKRIYTVIG